MRLKVADDFLDGDNSIIAQTYAVNEIGSIETRQGGFSNNFTIPLTSKNKAILGFPEDINSASRNPYTKVDATMFDKGVPVADGYLKYQVVNDTTLQASFFSDNVNWYNLIKDKTLNDLDLSAFDHLWRHFEIIQSFDLDKGYVYPLIDYGEFSANAPNMSDQIIVNVEQMFPGMFVSTLLEQIYLDAGWKADGPVLDHPLYKKMIVPWSGGKDLSHSLQWQEDFTVEHTMTGADQPFTDGLTVITFDGGITDIYTGGGDSRNFYDISFTIRANINAGAMQVILRDVVAGVNLQTKDFENWAGDEDKKGVFEDVNMSDFGAVAQNLAIAVLALTATETGNVVATSDVKLVPGLKCFDNNELQMANLQPPMKQGDFLNYIAFIFGAVLQSNTMSKTVTWSFFRDIPVNLNNSLDWSDKLDVSKTREIDFTELLNNYGQISIMTYKEDTESDDLEDYETLNKKRFGEGQFLLNNEHLDGIKTFYTAPFTPLFNKFSFANTLYIPSIQWIDGVGGAKGTLLPKIALITPKIDTNAFADNFNVLQIDDVTGANTQSFNVNFTWFAKETYIDEVNVFIDSLVFDQVNITDVIGTPLRGRFLDSYDNILNSMKFLRAFFHLNEVDISELDFTLPIFLDRYKAYFYTSKIENFEGRERTTKSELVKIG